MSHFQKIESAIQNAIDHPKKSNEFLTGFSGEKLLNTLINLSKYNLNSNKIYLEVGVFQGLSLLSVATNIEPNVLAYGIDNFAFFDPDGKNKSIVNSRIKQLQITNANLINLDYEDALEELPQFIGNKKIGVYFVDGPHDYRSQMMCLLLAQPYLSEDVIIIVDDSNYRHVRQANRDFVLTHPEYKLFFEAYTKCHPGNMSHEEKEDAKKSWWNGVNIIVRDKNNVLKPVFPPTHRDRSLYENEHILQSSKYPTLPLFLEKYIRRIGNMTLKFKNKKIQAGQYNSMNTYSENLTSSNFLQKPKE